MRNKPDNALLILGTVLLLLPLAFVIAVPDRFETAQFYLRLVASLGGALIGAWLPGLLHIEMPGISAGGALAVLVLFWLFNPPQQLKEAIAPVPEIAREPPSVVPNAETSPASEAPLKREPEQVCAFMSIKALGWSGGHKTNFCKANGYEHGNFNQGDYSNGGICITGKEPQVCKDQVTGNLEVEFNCRLEGPRTLCFRA